MNAIDDLLSEAADLIQDRLEADHTLEAQVAALLEQGQSPAVVRPMRNPRNSEVCIVIRRV